jgi:hypothetical protein
MATTMSLGALAYGPLERLIGNPKLTTVVGSLATGAGFVALGLAGHRSAALALVLFGFVGAAGLTYGILMAHARQFFPAHLLGRGVTFMNFAFIGGAGVTQWLSGFFVEAAQRTGEPPSATFGQLFLAFGAALLAATAIYAVAPRGREVRA